MSDNNSLYRYILQLGDNSMILGHRLSELCGHGPTLETDIALTNISLDLFGQVRSYYQYAAKIKGGDTTEDKIAFLRNERQYYNCILAEQKNKDFAHVIVRQFLFDAYHKLLLEGLCSSKDKTISAIANKSIKESKYHLRFSSEWVKRLGGGTEVSHKKTQAAVDYLYPFAHELNSPTAEEKEMAAAGIAPESESLKTAYNETLHSIFSEVGLNTDGLKDRFAKGKSGQHTELLGYILGELQYMQRTYPEMQW